MAQDFAKRSPGSKGKRGKQEPVPRFSLGSFVAGVVTGVGLFLLGAYGPELWNAQNARLAAEQTAPGRTDTPEPAQSPAQDAAEPPDLQFVFRDLLGADEVDPDLSAYETSIAANTPEARERPMQYLLQTGSFQIRTDADLRRGALLLLDLPATIVEARIDNKTWYRVLVGPYSQRGEAQQVAHQLRDNDIASMWLEQPVSEG